MYLNRKQVAAALLLLLPYLTLSLSLPLLLCLLSSSCPLSLQPLSCPYLNKGVHLPPKLCKVREKEEEGLVCVCLEGGTVCACVVYVCVTRRQ